LTFVLLAVTQFSAAGFSAEQLANAEALTPAGGYTGPRFSPDGQNIACSGEKWTGIYLILPGKPPALLTEGEMAGHEFVWAQDGESILFRKRTNERDLGCFRVDLQGSVTPLGTAVRRVTAPLLIQGVPFVHIRGAAQPQALTTDAPQQQPVIFAAGIDDQIVIWDRGNQRIVSEPSEAFFSPRLSPNGKRVAFMSLTSGIHAVNIDGSGHVVIGPGNQPSWCPDSQHLVFCHPIDDGETVYASELYMARADGSTPPVEITATLDRIETHPEVSRDGRHIVYAANGVIYRAELPPELRTTPSEEVAR